MTRAPFSLADTWDHVADLYTWIVSLFGKAEAIAACRLLTRARRREILAWLGPVEALARRLLLLKALTLPAPNGPPAPRAKGKLACAYTDRPAWQPAENAEDWRVWFRVAPCMNNSDRRHPAGPFLPAGSRQSGNLAEIVLNALPLARRIEALRRVLENPEPAVKRLAALLVTRRNDLAAAFTHYRPPANIVRAALDEAQEEVARALNSS